MRDPGLDFQPRRPGLLTVVLLLAGVLLCADAWLEDRNLQGQLDEAAARLAQAKRRADRLDAGRRDSQPENVFSAEEAKALRQTMGLIRVDWERLFRSIEDATGEDVALLAIRPSASGKSVQLSGEARNMAAALAFVDALRREPLSNVVLLSHQIRQSDPQQPILFEISATWSTGS
ncbi:MAG: hypothetical protein H6R14_2468 [Proteobacteria bacterium]|nr:hypothetical protein [Pseudomonadota bacterium]